MPVRQPNPRLRSPWRYALILVVVCLAVVVAAAAGWRFARTSASPSNGPVILVSIDGLRADRLPVYGYRDGRTPAIDALARDGVVFERAYSHSPLALPAHTSILSGQLPFETGVRDDSDVVAGATTLLPQLMKARGYKTAAVVSNPVLGRAAGLAPAFDFYNAEFEQVGRTATARPGDKTIAAARKWVDSAGSARFLLFLQLAAVAEAPLIEPADAVQPQSAYDEQVTKADGLLAQLVKWLKGRGLYDRATIVVLAAHGQGLGTHGEQGHGLLLYDETMRVPLVMKLPRDVNHGRRVADPVQHVDVLPTVLDLLDEPKPAFARGRSLRWLAMGKGNPLPEQPVYGESLLGRRLFGWAELQSLTDARYRYVKAPREELYDLAQDPNESRNIAGDQPAVVQRMRESLAQLEGANRTPADATAVDPKDKIDAYEKYVSATALTAASRLQEAAAAWREFLSMEPASAAGSLQLAGVLQNAGRFQEAADACDRLLKVDDRNVDAWLGSAYALLRAGKTSEAKTRAARAVELSPAPAHELLARIAVERKDWKEAARQAELARAADNSTTAVEFVSGVQLYRAAEYEQALPLLRAAARPEAAGARTLADAGWYLADALGHLEQYAEAESAWREEIARSPYDVRSRVSLAMLFHAEHRESESAQQVDELVRAVPTADAYSAAARLWTILGEKDRADEVRAQARSRFGEEATRTRAR